MILVARYALILTFFLSSCNWQSNTETKVTGEIYGTTYKYIFNHPADKPSNELINQQILEELNRIDLIFSFNLIRQFSFLTERIKALFI